MSEQQSNSYELHVQTDAEDRWRDWKKVTDAQQTVITEAQARIEALEAALVRYRNKVALVDELLSNYDVDALKLGDVSCDYCGAELQREPHRVLDKWMADRPELIGLMCPVARYNAIEEEDK